MGWQMPSRPIRHRFSFFDPQNEANKIKNKTKGRKQQKTNVIRPVDT
jgi:hypothetical protein